MKVNKPFQQNNSTTFLSLTEAASKYCKSLSAEAHDKLQHNHRYSARSQVLQLGSEVGNLCTKILTNAPLDPHRPPIPTNVIETDFFPPTLKDDKFWSERSRVREEIIDAIGMVFFALVVLSEMCQVDLRSCILKKMDLNRRKYPVKLCKGKSGKYTDYSSQTGITKMEGQCTLDAKEKKESESNGRLDCKSPALQTISGMTLFVRKFAIERQWQRYHTPRNIVLAMMGELGELAELFQWQGDNNLSTIDIKYNDDTGCLAGFKQEEIDHIQQELADVSIYCLRLADVCGVHDLGAVALKVAKV